MREILFRAKAINRELNQEYRTKYKNGDWVYGLVEKLPIIKNGEKIYDIDYAKMRNTCGVSGIEVDENTICEFTGLTDRSNRQIFEGDIVGCFGNTQIFVVNWCSIRGGYFLDDVITSGLCESHPECLGNLSDTIEVLGNIYDNPELLGGTK